MELHTDIIRGGASGQPVSQEWNQLWNSGGGGQDSCPAEVIQCYQRHFAPSAELVWIAVRGGQQQWLAGLPLLLERTRRLGPTCVSPGNEWYQCGQMVMASTANPSTIADAVLSGLGELGAGCYWLDWLRIDLPIWKCVVERAEQLGWGTQCKRRFAVGLTWLPGSWQQFEREMSRNNRKRCRSELKKVWQSGRVELEVFSPAAPEPFEQAWQTALEIEAASWKGSLGTAMASQPGIAQFFRQNLQYLSVHGQPRIFLLQLDGRAVAFDLGLLHQGYYRALKVSFRQPWAHLSPGHVLNQLVLRHFIDSGEASVVDTVGPLNDANRRWSNDSYSMGRLVLAPGTWFSNTAGKSLVSLLNVHAAWRGESAAAGAQVDS